MVRRILALVGSNFMSVGCPMINTISLKIKMSLSFFCFVPADKILHRDRIEPNDGHYVSIIFVEIRLV